MKKFLVILKKDYFDVEDWRSERLEFEIKSIREFLFSCSIFKGAFFIEKLNDEITEIEYNCNNFREIVKPNWLQKEIVELLKENIQYIKEEIVEDFSGIYPEINKVFEIEKRSKPLNNSKTLSKEHIWYKIAQLMTNGTIVITDKNEYLFRGELVKVELKMRKLVSEDLNGSIKAGSIKPYLNNTKSATGDNKDVFIQKRLDELTLIASESENNNCLNDYFKNKLETLKSNFL